MKRKHEGGESIKQLTAVDEYMTKQSEHWDDLRYVFTLALTYGIVVLFLNGLSYISFSGIMYGLEFCGAIVVLTIFFYNKIYDESGIVTVLLGVITYLIVFIMFDQSIHITTSSNLLTLAVWSASISIGGGFSLLYAYWPQILSKLNIFDIRQD